MTLHKHLVKPHCFGSCYKYSDCEESCPYFNECYNETAKKEILEDEM